MNLRSCAVLLLAFLLAPAVARAADGTAPRTLYERALEREQGLRMADPPPTLQQLRNVIRAYGAIVRRFPGSGYSDNALWQAGQLALLAYERFGQPADRLTATRLLLQLKHEYPASSLVARVNDTLRDMKAGPPGGGSGKTGDRTYKAEGGSGKAEIGAGKAESGSDGTDRPVMIRDIKRTPLPNGIRMTVELEAEALFRAERLENPRRVFFDLKDTRPVPALQDATLRFGDDLVREVRLGRHPRNTTRIVFDLEGVENYSVFTLYGPFRLVIDFTAGVPVTAGSGGQPAALPPPVAVRPLEKLPVTVVAPVPPPALTPAAPAKPAPERSLEEPLPLASRPVLTSPAVPSANSDGKFSIARQLGLGVSRIVIDAGHGGHDPGAQSKGLTEAELVLDVALRLGRLLQKQPGIEVVMTRATDDFVPLEERTAIANREGADLFLSIHANASRNPTARGVETYFLDFASNPDAAAVAARENSASGRAMHSLPDIVRAIAFNNKLDESRDFAEMVQRSMVRRLSSRNRQLKDLGVKRAPFVVLIGAAMPSVLAEISFVTHKQEGQLLKTGAYRQQIAEALFDAVLRYQQSLKRLKIGPVGIGAR
jgi:N-acetylmuramoyl-L-alanine amidase